MKKLVTTLAAIFIVISISTVNSAHSMECNPNEINIVLKTVNMCTTLSTSEYLTCDDISKIVYVNGITQLANNPEYIPAFRVYYNEGGLGKICIDSCNTARQIGINETRKLYRNRINLICNN